MREYRKTYWSLVVWCLALLPVMLGSAKIAQNAGMDERGMTALMMVVVVLMLIGLMWIIKLGGYVYWINGGPSFEEAKAAGEEMRREYAQKHLSAMLKGGIAVAVLMAAEYFAGVHEIAMVLSAGVCIIVAALRMIPIRWQETEKHDSEN